MHFSLFGIKFKISLIFAISISLFLAFDTTKSFLPLFLSITIHEVSHIVFLCFFDAKPKEISLDMGTINIKNKTPLSSSEEIIVLLAGPMSNLILYFLANVLHNIGNFSNINLCLFVINMLLIDGLDGGEILKIILNNICSNKTAAIIMIILKIINLLLIVSFFFIGLYFGIVNYTLLFFIFYAFINKKIYTKQQ